jgi:selenide,water dikinase
LRRLPVFESPDLLVGMNPADDAAVYRLDDAQALVFTTDFFTPIVDEPQDFGAIAAANALSDIYAMGGRPILALNLVAYPMKTLPLEVLSEILVGGGVVAREAGVVVAGGHSIDDAEPKYGMAVVGLVHPAEIWAKAGARPGDRLYLTKPLGTGIVTTALKRDGAHPDHLAAAVASMRRLNRAAMEAGRAAQVRCATDITGYGFLGHLLEVCRASGVRARVSAGALPLLPGVRDYILRGFIPGGTRANLAYAVEAVAFAPEVDEPSRILAADAQTSGGLLLAIPAERAAVLEQELAARGVLGAAVGEILPGGDGPVIALVS